MKTKADPKRTLTQIQTEYGDQIMTLTAKEQIEYALGAIAEAKGHNERGDVVLRDQALRTAGEFPAATAWNKVGKLTWVPRIAKAIKAAGL